MKLYFRYSAMNAGKTTQLLQIAHNYEERNMKILIAKPALDTKGSDMVVSRIGVKRKVNVLISKDMDIFNHVNKIKNKPNCILVDESHFLTKEHIDQLMNITVKLEIPVICYGLRTDFKTNGFSGSDRLLQVAHVVEELKTICLCGKKAVLNGRKINGTFTFDGNQVEIDNQDSIEYLSLCPKCYFSIKDELTNTNKSSGGLL